MLKMEIPLLVALELLKHHDDDRMQHELRVAVIGQKAEPLTVRIKSEFFKWPHIDLVISDGGLNLPPRLFDHLVFCCFGAIAMDLDDCNVTERVVEDITPWIECQFLQSEVDLLLAELGKHVDPNLAGVDVRQATFMIPVSLKDLKL